MLKTKRVLQIFLFLAIFREQIYGREFIRCPDLEGIHRDAASFLDFILSSRLSCGSKCTEHKDQCWSYAWNGATKQCMLFSDRCSTDFITDQHQNNWVHYKVQVLFDIAINKTAVQSSTFENNVADGAVDGNRGTDLKEDFCTHTGENDTNPWWMVDLQAVYHITTVRILNRGMDEYGVSRKTKELL